MENVGGATTVRLAVLLVVPVPPSVDVIALVVLLFVPAVVPVTFTENVQDDPTAGEAARVPPLKLTLPLPATAVMVPAPQVPDRPFGVATTSPADRVSVKATPLSVLAVLGLVTVNDNEVLPFSGMLDVPNTLLTVGGATTVRFAVFDAKPAPLSVELTTPVVLLLTPAVVPCTSTVTEHEVLAPTVPPDKLTDPPPATAVTEPAQVLTRLTGVPTTRPAGSVSENASPVKPIVFELLIVIVRVVVPFNGIDAAPNALLMVGGDATVIDARAVLPVPPFPELTVTLLFFIPDVVPITVATTVQEFPGVAMDAPPSEIVPDPLTAVTDPLQVLVGTGGFTTTIPAGRLSINVIVVSAPGFAAGFVIVKVTVVVPPTGIDDAPNALAI